MPRWPRDASKRSVVKAFEALGFAIVREREHISMERRNADGSRASLTMPNHAIMKGSTLRTICNQCGISREEFLAVFR